MLAPTQAVGGSFKKKNYKPNEKLYIYIYEATSCLELQKSAAASVKESEAGNGFEKKQFGGEGLGFLLPHWFVSCMFMQNTGEAYGGTMSPLTQKLARLGCSGKFPNNVERDLFRALQLPVAPFFIKVPTRSPNNRADIELTRIPILLPHQMYHFLFDAEIIQFSFFLCCPQKKS